VTGQEDDVIRVVLFSEINSKLGAPFLDLLAADPRVDLVAVVSSPPGRRCSYFVDDEEQVDLAARGRDLGVPVLRPVDVNAPDVVSALRLLRPDYFVVGNFQRILKPDLLAVPAVTAINFHPSPLPRYAGLAPFYWMVRHGERHGAVTALIVDEGIDTGDVVAQREMPLTGRETALQLRTAQEHANVRLLAELIPSLVNGSFTRTPQDFTRRSYFGRPRERDHLIDFELTAEEVARIVRAGYRHPGAFTLRPDGSKLVILSVTPAQGRHREPLAAPGVVRRTPFGVFAAAADRWLRLVTVEHAGTEAPASAVLRDGERLGAALLV
jgi:methionyl-tRNA formyltransferase